jgi:predicted ribosome quality control (RQC) complex YloA/Tae2 family protein
VAELSGFEVLGLLKEIGSTLRGTYVNNIFSAGASQLFRFRKADSADIWVVVSPKKGVWISEKLAERDQTTGFTSKLRGELERAKFTGTSQADLDRVFELHFERDGKRTLVVELMPPGNVIVLDQEDRVVLAEEEVRARSRRVVRGEIYQPPPQSRTSPASVGSGDVRRAASEEKTAGAAIGRHIGIPRKYVTELLARLDMTEGSSSSDLLDRGDEVSAKLRELLAEVTLSPKPCIAGTPRGDEIFAVLPTGLTVKSEANTLSELCDSVLLNEAIADVATAPAEDTGKELEATMLKLRADSQGFLDESAKARKAAKEAASGSMEEALQILRKSGGPTARLPTSAAAVASATFDHAKVLERRSAESLEAAGRLEKRRARASPPKGRNTTLLQRRKPEWFEKFRWFVTSEGKLAVGGRDAQSNTLLIKRHLEEGDVVYHADLFGSPFFVLKDGSRQSESEVLEVSQATVSFSSGWKTGLGAADAYWVLKDQVSGTAESGEFLAKGSFVIRGKKNFVRHAMLQLALGIDAGGRVMAGPESAVAKACRKYVVLIPHREKASDTAKKVLRELTPSGAGAGAASLDDVIRALPSGGGKIVRKKSSDDLREKP